MPNEEPQDLLVLDSRLTEVSRAESWGDGIADRLGLGDRTRYAIRLCLEEALANVILHGYRNEPGHRIVLRGRVSAGMLFFEIEDEAPPFVPDGALLARDRSAPASLETLTPGGNGIRLLQDFASSLVYEQLGEGNRLTIGFPVEG
jgi:anti-sigma regulatory factor (Ser/Thr protein kinase)